MEYTVFWCKVNKFYINKWLDRFNRRWFSDASYFSKNNHLVATCVVTDRAKSKRVKEVRKLLQSWKKVFLTWCGAFEKWEAMDYESFFCIYPSLEQRKDSLFLLGEDPENQTDTTWLSEYDLNKEIWIEEVSRQNKWQEVSTNASLSRFTKKFIVIQSWCDTFCTFCLTIYKRWSNRNRPLSEILDEINMFVANWWQEIVITWVNLAAWWCSHTRKPEQSQFSNLLENILLKTSIPRIRISSLWPEFLNDHFFEVVSDTRFLPHFHFSIQHFDDELLARMNRNYWSKILDNVLTKIRNIKRTDREYISIWWDLIVWFPWEDDDAFQKILDWIRSYWITKVHAFPFSPHLKWEHVPAWSLSGQIDMNIKKDRMSQVLDLAERVRSDFIRKNKWVEHDVLIENRTEWGWKWWTPNYLEKVVNWNYYRWQVVSTFF